MARVEALQPNTSPLADINTTPLIDVMLVLLIMFVMTIPAATHSLQVPLPSEGEPGLPIKPVNLLSISASQAVEWNGQVVSLEQLDRLLAASTSLPIEPELRFQPEAGASYGLSADVLRRIERSGVTAFGFVGTEQFAQFPKQR